MSYLTKEMADSAIAKMAAFHNNLKDFYERHDMDFLEDLGRRNILMSRPQENFFAEALRSKYPTAYSDGKTGQPDIIIPEINTELECKITSPHKSGSWGLQTDHGTLSQKGSLDYLYVLCNRDFDEFGVFHFKGLTIDDFRKPSPGSRGKVSLIMRNAVKKCSILVGSISSRTEFNLEKLSRKKAAATTPEQIEKINKSIEYWTNTPASYSISLEKMQNKPFHVENRA